MKQKENRGFTFIYKIEKKKLFEMKKKKKKIRILLNNLFLK